MKIETKMLGIIAIIGISTFCSCGAKVSKDDATRFYAKIFFMKERINKSGNEAIYKYDDMHSTAEITNQPISDSIANFLKTEMNKHLGVIDSSLQAISNMAELDKGLSLLESMKSFLNFEKKFWINVMLVSLEYHRIGLMNLDKEQAETYQSFEGEADKSNEENQKINHKIAAFGEKYDIKKSDLKRLNLLE